MLIYNSKPPVCMKMLMCPNIFHQKQLERANLGFNILKRLLKGFELAHKIVLVLSNCIERRLYNGLFLKSLLHYLSKTFLKNCPPKIYKLLKK